MSITRYELRHPHRFLLLFSRFLSTWRQHRYSFPWLGVGDLRGARVEDVSGYSPSLNVTSGCTGVTLSHQNIQHDGTCTVCNARRSVFGECSSLFERDGKWSTCFLLFCRNDRCLLTPEFFSYFATCSGEFTGPLATMVRFQSFLMIPTSTPCSERPNGVICVIIPSAIPIPRLFSVQS